MSSISSTASRPVVFARFAAAVAGATVMAVTIQASAQLAGACPPEHLKMDAKIHAVAHRQHVDRGSADRQATHRDRLDRPEPGRQRVIIRAKAGTRGALESAGRSHGHSIRADHDFINAFTADVDEDDLARLAADPRVESVSLDADMQGDQEALDSPLTTIAQRTGSGSSSAAPNPAAVRGTLGLTASNWSGTGVTVALVD